jgi:hypothetical protein
MTTLSELWAEDQGQDVAEYAVILTTILVVVNGTIPLVGSNTSDGFQQWPVHCNSRAERTWHLS